MTIVCILKVGKSNLTGIVIIMNLESELFILEHIFSVTK